MSFMLNKLHESCSQVDGPQRRNGPLTGWGERTIESAERVFVDLGYHGAYITKITEAARVTQGTLDICCTGKQAVFDELVEDLNRWLRQTRLETSMEGTDRAKPERLGFSDPFSFVLPPITWPSTGLSAKPRLFLSSSCACTMTASRRAARWGCTRPGSLANLPTLSRWSKPGRSWRSARSLRCVGTYETKLTHSRPTPSIEQMIGIQSTNPHLLNKSLSRTRTRRSQ